MLGANLVFHLGSAALFALLVYLIIRLKQQRDFLRFLFKVAAESNFQPVLADWPVQCLRKFCLALNIEISEPNGEWPSAWLRLQKIRLKDLAELHRTSGLKRITVSAAVGQVCFECGFVNAPSGQSSIDFGFEVVALKY